MIQRTGTTTRITERIRIGQERLKLASSELNDHFVQIIRLGQVHDSTTEIGKVLRELDIDMHDVMGALAHVHNSLYFAGRDLEKSRRYRVIVATETGEKPIDSPDGEEWTRETAEFYLTLQGEGFPGRIETRIATPWETIK